MDGGTTILHQLDCQPSFHAHSIRHEKSPPGIDRHRDRMGHDHLEHGSHLVSFQVARTRTNTLSSLGFHRERTAMDDHYLELG